MNITPNEIEKLRRLVTRSLKEQGAVSVSDRDATNYPCPGTCSYTCSSFCDGTGVRGVCWQAYVGSR